MIRPVLILLAGFALGLCCIRAQTPLVDLDAEARLATVETTMRPVTHNVTDLQTLAWEIQEVRNTVVNRTDNVQNEIRPWIWMVIAVQGFQMLQTLGAAWMAKRRCKPA